MPRGTVAPAPPPWQHRWSSDQVLPLTALDVRSLLEVPGLAAPVGEVGSSGQGVPVVGAEHALDVAEQLLQGSRRAVGVPRPPAPLGEVARVAKVWGWSGPSTRRKSISSSW